MKASSRVSVTGQCPRCKSHDVEKHAYECPYEGILIQTKCATCGFWVGNCAFDNGKGEIEHRGFVEGGMVPPDLPVTMKRAVAKWR